MRVLKAALATAFMAASMIAVTGVASSDTAEAKGKKKDRPGMCGTMKYFDKKSKACKSKG